MEPDKKAQSQAAIARFDFGSLEKKRGGLSVQSLADRIGTSADTLWHWESGRREPEALTIFVRLAMELAVQFADPRYLDIRQWVKWPQIVVSETGKLDELGNLEPDEEKS